MKISDSLQGIRRLFLDTAPVIYYIEENSLFFATVEVAFELISDGVITAITSPITLAECLVMPYRETNTELEQKFIDVSIAGENTEFFDIDAEVGKQAAQLRASYNLTLPDSLQLAVALRANCDGFLTNDMALKRVQELTILVVSEFNG